METINTYAKGSSQNLSEGNGCESGTLQDMDKMDAVNEGIDQRLCVNLKHALTKFKKVWNSTIRKSDIDRYGWDANPYVWVIGIERIEVTQ